MTEPAIDASAEEEQSISREIVPAPPTVSLAPAGTAQQLVERLETIKAAMRDAMEKDVDYGVIPGTNKPTLLKPGAEKLVGLFLLDVQYPQEDDTRAGDHLTVRTRAVVYSVLTGARLGAGVGECSSREKKYAYRRAELVCPDCGKANVRKSKPPRTGFYCWVKTDGCGAQFSAEDERITSQVVGDIENPDLPDTWNTIRKMAKKRALVDAVLSVTSASAIFTQDAEDAPQTLEPQPEPAQPPPLKGTRAQLPPRLLTAEEHDRVVAAVEEAGWDMTLVLAALGGAPATADLTTEDAKRIREMLDKAKAKA